jgi:hypothetical protein
MILGNEELNLLIEYFEGQKFTKKNTEIMKYYFCQILKKYSQDHNIEIMDDDKLEESIFVKRNSNSGEIEIGNNFSQNKKIILYK